MRRATRWSALRMSGRDMGASTVRSDALSWSVCCDAIMAASSETVAQSGPSFIPEWICWLLVASLRPSRVGVWPPCVNAFDRHSISRPLTGPPQKLIHCEYIVREGCVFQLRRSSPIGRGLRLGEMSAQKMAGGEPRTWSAYPRSDCSLVPVQSLWKHRAASELRGQAGICLVRTTQESGVLWLLLRLLAIIQSDWGTEIAKLPCELGQSASSSSAHLRALGPVRRAASS